ncbi:E3 ubiquitin-protein ligase Iruka isoform X2 [Colletes latitarsis]|uniref:E3 ubiquitin-protein ligase Iruka isoform X2 n=1 Tax=Colletes latitarsis TaxID=2605962 RepID=UPI004035F09B
MAEAVMNGSSLSRFFCHRCNIEIEGLLPDYTCPRCASGFIEELESGSNDSSSGIDFSHLIEDLGDIDDLSTYNFPNLNDLEHYDLEHDELEFDELPELTLHLPSPRPTANAPNRNNVPAGRRGVNWTRTNSDTSLSGSRRRGAQARFLPNLLQDFLLHLARAGPGHPQYRQPPVLFLGNPGDYVWGQEGLDAIVTQMLNQLDGAGPPPLPRKQIDEIPTTSVTQCQVDSKLQCSVCWEDFRVLEAVKQLPCQHLFHSPCIVPWLELHRTCPICRQRLGGQTSPEANQDIVGSSLAALFRAANESSSTSSSSTSSTSESLD